MILATERQRMRMDELGIPHDETMTLDEATELIRAENEKADNHIRIRAEQLNENALALNSEWED